MFHPDQHTGDTVKRTALALPAPTEATALYMSAQSRQQLYAHRGAYTVHARRRGPGQHTALAILANIERALAIKAAS